MNIIKIAFVGYKGCGKTTACTHLKHKYGMAPMSFSAPLKDMLRVIGVPESSLSGTQEQKESPLSEFSGVSGRKMMQTLGTEWGRNLVYSNIWVDLFIKNSENLPKSQVVDDARFPNEIEALRKSGFYIVRVSRSELSSNDAHESEKHVSRIVPDEELVNDSSLVSFLENVDALVCRIGGDYNG